MQITTTATELLAMSEGDLARLEALLTRFNRPVVTPYQPTTENAPRAANEEREARDAYAEKFGIGFRQCKGNPTDSASIVKSIQACIDANMTAKEFYNNRPFEIGDPFEESPDIDFDAPPMD